LGKWFRYAFAPSLSPLPAVGQDFNVSLNEYIFSSVSPPLSQKRPTFTLNASSNPLLIESVVRSEFIRIHKPSRILYGIPSEPISLSCPPFRPLPRFSGTARLFSKLPLTFYLFSSPRYVDLSRRCDSVPSLPFYFYRTRSSCSGVFFSPTPPSFFPVDLLN